MSGCIVAVSSEAMPQESSKASARNNASRDVFESMALFLIYCVGVPGATMPHASTVGWGQKERGSRGGEVKEVTEKKSKSLGGNPSAPAEFWVFPPLPSGQRQGKPVSFVGRHEPSSVVGCYSSE